MSAYVLRVERNRNGLRPFDPYRDLGAVVELIAIAFDERLGPAGEVTLARMRQYARRSELWKWLGPLVGMAGVTPGLVWVEDDEVVGNVSLRRAASRGGYLIGNVVVHPDWRGRGIGSALMEAALERISARGGRWVGLEVRESNRVARQLYAGLGFREVGTTYHAMRPTGAEWDGRSPSLPHLRRGRARDGDALIDLMHAVVPREQRPLLELRADDYRPGWVRAIGQLLQGRREAWWVVDRGGEIEGAIRAVRERDRYPNRLEILIRPGRSGRFESALVRKGLSSLNGSPEKAVEVALPTPTGPLIAALGEQEIHKLHTLVQMKRDLVRRIPVKGPPGRV